MGGRQQPKAEARQDTSTADQALIVEKALQAGQEQTEARMGNVNPWQTESSVAFFNVEVFSDFFRAPTTDD